MAKYIKGEDGLCGLILSRIEIEAIYIITGAQSGENSKHRLASLNIFNELSRTGEFNASCVSHFSQPPIWKEPK